jgi:hypothetical protein
MLSLTVRQKAGLHARKFAQSTRMPPLFRIREASLLVHHFDLLIDYSSPLRPAIPSLPRVAGRERFHRRDQARCAANSASRLGR